MKYAISHQHKYLHYLQMTYILLYSGYNIDNMCEIISRALSIVNEWPCANKISLHLEKNIFHFIYKI